MSKTDKTDPYFVKAAQYPSERHDHRKGFCDLPTDPKEFGFRGHGKCYVDAQWWRPVFRCGCKMCSGEAYGWGARAEAHRARRKGRQEARNARRENMRGATLDT